MRVVCEFCQTVYNIPDAKLVRDVSQATCKVCRNKIVIRRDPNAIPSEESSAPTTIRPPRSATPASPATAPTLAGPPATGGPFNEEALPETELSSSWQEAIVDNRDTIAMLRKVGVRGPPDGSTATGGKAADPADGGTPEEEYGDAGYDDSSEADYEPSDGPAAPAKRTRRKAAAPRVTGFSAGGPSASAALSFLAAVGAGGAAAMLVHNGAWGLGLSGLLAFAGCVFASTGSLLNALVRRRSFVVVGALLIVAGMTTIAATGGLLATGGARTRALAAVHPLLEPLARIATDLER